MQNLKDFWWIILEMLCISWWTSYNAVKSGSISLAADVDEIMECLERICGGIALRDRLAIPNRTKMNQIAALLLLFIALCSAGNVKPRKEVYLPNYKYYHNVSSIGKFVTDLVVKHSNYFRLDLDYKSRSNVPQYVLHMTNFSSARTSYGTYSVSNTKPRFLLSYGEHAREFFPVESMIRLLERIVSGLSAAPNSPEDLYTRKVLSQLDVYIIVIANPDGRHHIEKTSNYCWRGTSVGVDLDRNFKWNFGGRGSSGDPTDEEYRGPYPHSGELVTYNKGSIHWHICKCSKSPWNFYCR